MKPDHAPNEDDRKNADPRVDPRVDAGEPPESGSDQKKKPRQPWRRRSGGVAAATKKSIGISQKRDENVNTKKLMDHIFITILSQFDEFGKSLD